MADYSIFKLLKNYLLKLKSFLFSKNVLSFLLFLVLSSGFWFLNALDKVRETEITIPIRFDGLAQNIAITNLPENTIVIKVKDQGVNLFSYSRHQLSEIVFDVNRTFYEKGVIRISADQIRGKLSRYLLPSTTLIEIKPDSLVLNYEKLSVATLPIELISDIKLKQQYLLSEKIHLSPEKITVFGPKRILDKLKSVKTEKILLEDVDDTTFLEAKLKPIESVRFASTETKVSIFVEMFTEKKMQLPVLIVNQPNNQVIRTFPAFVNVTFNVGLSHFNSIKLDEISIELDYNEIIKNGEAKQLLKINNKAPYISNIRIFPEEVEYLIETK